MADNDEKIEENKPEHPDRWQVMLDLAAFQFKLVLDAIRDVLLSPVSIATALFGIMTDQRNPGKYFYSLLKQGHKTDDWINLFGTSSDQDESKQSSSSDMYIRKVENMVLNEYEKGGLVKNLKDKADRLIDKSNRD
jgi:hypothetical protein